MPMRRFQSLDEIRLIPGYVAHISHIERQEPKFLGYYRLKDKIQCALTDCHHWHGYGYVAETADGRVVAIGNVCGGQLFGDLWQAAASSFDKEVRRMQLRESIAGRLSGIPALLERIDALLYAPRGPVWLEKAERSLVKVCPARVMKALYDRVSHGDAEIVASRERDNENDLRLGFDKKSDIVTEVIGRFEGLAALAMPSPRVLLAERLRDPLRQYLNVTADALMEPGERRRFQAIHRGVEGHMHTAERRLQEARLFFTTANLQLLAHLAQSPGDRQLLQRLIWNDSAGVVQVARAAA